MAPGLDDAFDAELSRWEAVGRRRTLDAAPASERAADFVSNDYLGLSSHPEVVAAGREALERLGAGGRAARLLGGGGPLAGVVERTVADWLGAEAALLFPSGYQANAGLPQALLEPGDAVFSDALNHASQIDGVRLARARRTVFRHGDLDELERGLASARGARRRLVLVEGLYGMDGDLAPLAELAELCARHDAWLVIDEAHAAGVIGPHGRGAWAAADVQTELAERCLARVVTGGKALGVAGGLVVGSRALIELLANRARSFVFTTAPPPAVSAALARAVELASDMGAERDRLHTLAGRLAERLDLSCPAGAILPVPIGPDAAAVALSLELGRRALDVRAVRPPTVPEGTARLRVALHASNTDAEVEALGAALLELRPAPLPAAPCAPHVQRAKALFVAGTDTDIGKTVVSALLLRALGDDGCYWKPVQTGDDSDTDTVRALSGGRVLEPGRTFPLPASPHEAAAAVGAVIDPEALDRELTAHLVELESGTLLIELAGGLAVPYTLDFTQLDWLARRRAELVLVARSGLGTLNHTLLSLEALRARHLTLSYLILVGEPHPSNRETLAHLCAAQLVEVPRFAALGAAALDDWLAREGAALVPRFSPTSVTHT